jgi:hypothetical protein
MTCRAMARRLSTSFCLGLAVCSADLANPCTVPTGNPAMGTGCGSCIPKGGGTGHEYCYPNCSPGNKCVCCPAEQGGGFLDRFFLCVNGQMQSICCEGDAGTNAMGDLCCRSIADPFCN